MTHALPRRPAPALTVSTVDGPQWSLAESSPEAFTLVLFYRGLHCPKCKDQLRELDRRLDELAEVGITEVLAVSGDGAEVAAQTVADWGLGSLTVGHSLSPEVMAEWGLFRSTGLEGEPELFNEPGMALVGADGSLYSLWLQSTPFARPHLDQVISSTRWIRENAYPARGEVG